MSLPEGPMSNGGSHHPFSIPIHSPSRLLQTSRQATTPLLLEASTRSITVKPAICIHPISDSIWVRLCQCPCRIASHTRRPHST